MRSTRIAQILAIFASLGILCGCAALGIEPQVAATAYVAPWETFGIIVLGVGGFCLLLAIVAAIVASTRN